MDGSDLVSDLGVAVNNVVVFEASPDFSGESPKVAKMDNELSKDEPRGSSTVKNEALSPSAEVFAQPADEEMADVEAEKPKPQKEPSPGLGPLLIKAI